jgi:hypothetical protein
MNARAMRLILGGLLVATVVLRISAGPTENLDIRAAIVDVLTRHGHTVRDDAPDRVGEPLNSLFAAFQGCESPVQIMPVTLSVQEGAAFDATVPADYHRRFVYLGRTWPTADRLGIRLEWLREKTLSTLGLSRFVPIPTALLIAAPPDCKAADRFDWSAVWTRTTADRLAAATPSSLAGALRISHHY